MFRMLNVNALLARDYQLAGAGAGWRVARVDMMGGRESDSSAWTIALAKGGRQRLLSWADFLKSASLPGPPPQPAGDFMDAMLGRVTALLHDRARRREVARALRLGAPASEVLELLVRGEDDLAGWLQTNRALDPAASAGSAELMASLAADLASDRQLLQRGLTGPVAAGPATPLSIRLPDAAAEAHPRNELRERLDQACAACRSLLTLSGSQPAPGRAESVAQAVITGSVEAWLDERLRSVFPDHACEATVRTTPVREPSGGQRFSAELALEVPLWSLRQRSKLPLHLHLAIDGQVKVQARQLELLVRDTADLLRDWCAHRPAPLISGGDGWLGLLDHMAWDNDLFSRWLGAAATHERVARLAVIGKPPDGREKTEGWKALLSSVAGDADHLRAHEWRSLIPLLSNWDANQQGELSAALRRIVLARLRAPDAAAADLAEWVAAWREIGAPGAAQPLFTGLCERAARTRADADAGLALDFWRASQRPPDGIPALAVLWASLAACPAARVEELAAALPAEDLRRQASAAIAAAVQAVASDQPQLALPPLAQAEAPPKAWRTDEAWRGQVAALFAKWTAALDRSQQHEGWRTLLAHRATLMACHILTD
jgi:hypothetical protein